MLANIYMLSFLNNPSISMCCGQKNLNDAFLKCSTQYQPSPIQCYGAHTPIPQPLILYLTQ